MNGSELLLGDQQEVRLRRETLGTQVYHLLRDRILRGEIAGGSRLIQGPLAEEIGTSRIPVRDALKRLESDGLVMCDETGRYSVVQFGPEDAEEVYAIRRKLEPFAVEVAAKSMTSEAMGEIKSLFNELSGAARRRQLEKYIEERRPLIAPQTPETQKAPSFTALTGTPSFSAAPSLLPIA